MFWYIRPYSPLKVIRRFGGICRLLLHGERIAEQETNALLAICFTLLGSYFAYFSTLKM
jgi:hypothetical protein